MFVENFGRTEVLSPVSGMIEKISYENSECFKSGTKISVYIRGPNDDVQDDHNIFAPMSGLMSYSSFEGSIRESSFRSSIGKTGCMCFVVDEVIMFTVWVGSGFVTDEIVLSDRILRSYSKEKEMNSVEVVIGERIAGILVKKLNSYAEVFMNNEVDGFSRGSFSKGSILKGGSTSLGFLRDQLSSGKIFVVLAVPHYKCDTFGKYCDKTSGMAAKLIRKRLDELGILNSTLFGNVTRDVLDLNRKESRGSPFRSKLLNLVDSNEPAFVLDVHSFPEKMFETDKDVYLIEIASTSYSASLNAYLKSNGVSCEIFSGTRENDIMYEMLGKDVPTVLIEFKNELVEESLTYACLKVADWFDYYFTRESTHE